MPFTPVIIPFGVKKASEPFIAIPPPQSTFPCNVVIPDTFNDDMHVETLFKVAFPEIFKVDINVEGLLKLIVEGGFNIEL
jgi:hypothetical protein